MTDKTTNDDNEPINLNEKDGTVKLLRVAAGWDLKAYDGENIDVDLSCFLLDRDDKTTDDTDFIFYNNLKSADIAVRHTGDNRDGLGPNDDESILIDISSLGFYVFKIVFVVSIYMADQSNHSFKQVDNAFVRVVNDETDEEFARVDMAASYGDATAVRFCQIERIGSEWHFSILNQPTEGGLKAIAEDYGCLIASIG